jgi:adenylate cyclase
MSNEANDLKTLADQICDEVQACFPSELESSTVRHGLRTKINALLNERIRSPAPPESRRVTILLSDIRGFTALAETFSAMTVVEMLNRYFSCMTDVIVKYGGTIDKLMGDSIMVLFGAPEAKVDDVECAIACSVEMQQMMSVFNEQNIASGLPELFMGIGINTGMVVAASLGSDHHREYTVIGDEVNLTSRIEAQSLRGQILISANTYQLAKNYILVGEPNKVQVKGKQEPVALYELKGTTAPHSMTVPRREVRKSPRIIVNMPCMFQLVDGKTVLSEEHCGEVTDIGYNGLQMLSPVNLELFTEIKITVSLHLLGTNTSDIYARVVNIKHSNRGVICSLEFTSMDMAGQQSIKRFVDNLVDR